MKKLLFAACLAAFCLTSCNNGKNNTQDLANIAQIVNVLQSMILTKDKEMVLTPTYYVFKMYKVHQDATYLPIGEKHVLITSIGGCADTLSILFISNI